MPHADRQAGSPVGPDASPADGARHPAAVTVTDPAAARVLLDRRQVDLLAPFLGRERTAGEAALDVGLTLAQMLPRIQRFCRLGLLVVTRQQARAGRPMKVYRSAADEFFFPADAIAFERDMLRSERAWQRRFTASLEDALYGEMQRLDAAGVRVHRTSATEVRISPALAPGTAWDSAGSARPVVFSWRRARLTPAQARRLQARLAEVVRQCTDDPDGDWYLVGAHLTPDSDRPPV
ncbi:MAG: hypothetical protein ACRCSN_17820 [Dermatophilaceae bacterium]